MTFSECFNMVDALVKKNGYMPRRRVYMNDLAATDILLRATEELGELAQAETRDGNEIEELADLMSILMHYGIKKGYSEDSICEEMARKLTQRIVQQ